MSYASPRVTTEPLRDRAHGKWRSILPALGLKSEFMTGKNTPCPFCGGKDRWRFINRDGSGNWVCNHCGTGDGLSLAMRVVGQDFAVTAKAVEAVLGEAREELAKSQVTREAMKRLWESGVPLAGSPGELYFRGRGLEAPRCLRFVQKLRCTKSEWWPAVLAQIAGPDGKCANLYRIFLTMQGQKAPVEKPKRAMRAQTPLGSAIRLGGISVGPVLGIAEGIENALSAAKLHDLPVWAVTGTSFLEAFKIPDGVEELVIFADNDAHFAGQRAAYTRANAAVMRDGVKCRVEVPPVAGADWNDVLREMGSQP